MGYRFTYGLVLLLGLLLGACASPGPPALTDAPADSPSLAAVQAQAASHLGRQVLWGGVIIQTTNLQDSTQLEVLAYPLDASDRPQSGTTALGRFIVEQAGFLDPAGYAEGRLITVVGELTGMRSGRVGASEVRYPVVRGQAHHLWPQEREGSGINFGIGVGTWF